MRLLEVIKTAVTIGEVIKMAVIVGFDIKMFVINYNAASSKVATPRASNG